MRKYFIFASPRIAHAQVGCLLLFLCCLCLVYSAMSARGQSSINSTDNAAMVWVPGGSFTMGSPYGSVSGGETQQVTLSGYWIYTNEVTVGQYLQFCTATGHPLPEWPGDQFSWAGVYAWAQMNANEPIVNVTWNDAQAYAMWAGVSLPTEAQYEYAACGPQEHNYPWGGTATAADPDNGWDPTRCANCLNCYFQNISTWPVNSFASGVSWCGAMDMAGNVREWCADWYGDYSSTPVTNPTGPATGTSHVARGGGWEDNSEDCWRCTERYAMGPFFWDFLGFRCVSDQTPAPVPIQGQGPWQGDNWWMFQHDAQHTGQSAFCGPDSPMVQWSKPMPYAVSCPSIGTDGTIYVYGDVDGIGGKLYAFNPDGSLQWVSPYIGSNPVAPAIGADGTIYVATDALYAFTPSGTLKWSFAGFMGGFRHQPGHRERRHHLCREWLLSLCHHRQRSKLHDTVGISQCECQSGHRHGRHHLCRGRKFIGHHTGRHAQVGIGH